MASTVERIWKDLNKAADATLSFDECKEFLKIIFSAPQGLPFSDAHIRKIFTEMDVNKDAKLTKGDMAKFIISLTNF